MTLEQLAMEAVKLIVNNWKVVAGTVASGTAKVIGEDLWGYVKRRLTAAGRTEAVTDFEANPKDARNQKALEATLEKVLDNDSEFATEMRRVIDQATARRPQTIDQTGIANRGAIVIGDRNKIKMG
jgi:hypothetical protein